MSDFFLLTNRFKLRPFMLSDTKFMFELNSDPEVVRFTGDTSFQREEEARVVVESLIRQFTEKQMGRFIVLDIVSNEPIGWCGLKWHPDEQEVDLGYRFFRHLWGKGCATETSSACLEYGFKTLNLPKIVAHAEIKNLASIRVLEKLGFKKIGPSKYKGLIDAEDFVLLSQDYGSIKKLDR